MTTYVLVPGACHGAWCFRRSGRGAPSARTPSARRHADRHRRAGALAARRSQPRDAHRRRAVELAVHDINDAVLVGHSYGGMVITAVADRVPERVDALVYLDALVPQDGESCWDLVNDEERQWYLDVDDTGYGVRPMPFFDSRATAHPLASFLQRIALTGDLNRFRRRDFVYALKWPGDSPLRPSYERVRDDPSWITHELDGAHNLMRDSPEDLVRILLEVARH